MSIIDQFLKDIHSEDGKTTLLIFADYLEDHNQSRLAQLIRRKRKYKPIGIGNGTDMLFSRLGNYNGYYVSFGYGYSSGSYNVGLGFGYGYGFQNCPGIGDGCGYSYLSDSAGNGNNCGDISGVGNGSGQF